MSAKYRILGMNDDQNTCCQCGKKGLKRVVWLEALDAEGNGTGDVIHVGIDCAGQMIRGEKTRKNTVIVADEAKATELARTWLAKGFDEETCVKGIWNRFGYSFSRQIVQNAKVSVKPVKGGI